MNDHAASRGKIAPSRLNPERSAPPLRIPARSNPEAGEKGGCADRQQRPLDAVTREVIAFQNSDGVKRRDREAASNPLKPFHGFLFPHNLCQFGGWEAV